MPYEIVNPVDGEKVGLKFVKGEEDAERPELVFDNDQITPEWIWDAQALAPRPPSEAEALDEAKTDKEAELRDAADAWYQDNIRSFEGGVVIHKIDRGISLLAEEQAIRDAMTANYARLKDLIVQTRAATTLAEVEAIQWT